MKKTLSKSLKVIISLAVILYLMVCGWFYANQEKILFHPTKLQHNYAFEFNQRFEEISIQMDDDIALNALLFKADSAKGVILYFHGNGGALDSWGTVAGTYTQHNYDVFLVDYRGYGKSEGEISGQDEFFQDAQAVYDEVKTRYAEEDIIVLGYSLGTGPASKIASTNNPKMLILQAPYFSIKDMMQQNYSFLPTFMLKYPFKTNEYLPNCKMPVVVFHGDADKLIYYGSALKLQELFKPEDQLITLEGHGHSGITYNPVYQNKIAQILNN